MGGSVEKQIQKALGSLPPCGNRCRFSESAMCSSRVHPPSEIKSNFKFKALRWRLLRWRLTLSEIKGACGNPLTICQDGKSSLTIKFLGKIFLGHKGPRRRDIPDPSPGMSRTKALCKAPFPVVLDREWPGCPAL